MNHPSPQAPDALTTIMGVLDEHRHKAPRVQARLIVEALAGPAAPIPLPPRDREEPAAWVEAKRRRDEDPIAKLVDQGIATTRNRTHAAMRALGLNPTEVRALEIEHDTIRVYRWDPSAAPKQQCPYCKGRGCGDCDRGFITPSPRPSIPQTMPVLEEPA